MILAALGLFFYNQQEAAAADRSVTALLPELRTQIESNQSSGRESGAVTDPYSLEMDTLSVEGHDYIGYLMIPKLGIEMPIMSDWSMEKLRIAPTRYTGSVNGSDLVLMGHNYDRGFGQLPKMELGDEVYFRDVTGVVTAYQVVAKDILSADSVEEMVSGEYDMTLFTCTYGGRDRLTIRCDRIV